MTTHRNVTVVYDFYDGTLAADFEQLGYPARWKRGERRDLPETILNRVTNSGGMITFADDSAKESAIVEGAEPRHTEAKFAKGRMVVVFPEGFRDGTFANDLAAIGHPPEFGVGEIASLPLELIDRIKTSGGFVTTDPQFMLEFANRQGKHQLKVRQWQEEHEKAKQSLQARQEIDKHNKSILAEIEDVSTQYITATGKTKDALWLRRKELYRSLK